jgi:hypothetical protein
MHALICENSLACIPKEHAHLSFDQDSDFIINLFVSYLRGRITVGNRKGLVGLAKTKVSEPKWLTHDIKKNFSYKVCTLPTGLRLTKLTAKRKKP